MKNLAIFCCLVHATPIHAQEPKWYEAFFIEASGQYYFTPGFFSEFVKPDIGFRCALSYEYRYFHFALESGYTHITGTNPLVLDIRFIPVTLKAGYALSLGKGWGLQADLNLGWVFSKTLHYETAIDMYMENLQESSARSYTAGIRLFGTYSFVRCTGNTYALKLYAGGGIDTIFETGGPVPLPLFEAGVSFKPLALIQRKTAGKGQESSITKDETTDPEKPEITLIKDYIIIDQTKLDKTERLMKVVYFEPDRADMIEQYQLTLNKVGELLRENLSLRITLRGYAAPFGTAESCILVSEARIKYCNDYLVSNYGIAEGRIYTENYGAERAPEFANTSWESYRCVEMIIE
jgi:outer membrane protein OmpA-like peptidoglycan-associated protein